MNGLSYGVGQSLILRVSGDGVGRVARNGLNFMDQGFGALASLGCSDCDNTAVSQPKPGGTSIVAVKGIL
jgi:2-dehydro-3-deoxygluconokinase